MPPPVKAQEASEQLRRDTLAKWKASGLSQAEFSRNEGIPEWKMSNWKQRELRGEAKQVALRDRRRKAANTAVPRSVGVTVDGASESESPTKAPVKPPKSKQMVPFIPLVPPSPNSINQEPPIASVMPPKFIAEIEVGGVSIRVLSGADCPTLLSILQAVKELANC